MSSFYASVDNKLHVSIYSAQWQEVKEKRNIEVSAHTEPHSVLINKDGTILVACVGMNIHFYQAHNVQLQKTVTLEKEPSCTCIGEEGLLVATDNSSTIQIFNFEAIQTKKVVLEGLDQSDFPSDMTMVGDVIYLCTQKNGQALSYDQHGVKLSAFKSNDEQNYKANSIAVHQEKELVFILWNKCNVLVYSHLSNESLFSVDTTCATKVRLIDDYMMILIVPEKNEILVNDAETLIDFAALKKQFLATLEEKVRNDILLDSKQHESRQGQSSPKSPNSAVPLFSHNYSIQRSKILQQHLLRTFDVAQEQSELPCLKHIHIFRRLENNRWDMILPSVIGRYICTSGQSLIAKLLFRSIRVSERILFQKLITASVCSGEFMNEQISLQEEDVPSFD
ncbi:hypothetical protein BSL78_11539 [Apostichopus japonicus]|uniref:Adenosine/AMP deaminase N-terminal domain-containing protein n=1 Tax=Stichopus japonicus TaxID=307972 RepID=A0A2G8KU99_STIJA|nr:hypothetical protein BSL78_11539 [Apostichopus japonicus]